MHTDLVSEVIAIAARLAPLQAEDFAPVLQALTVRDLAVDEALLWPGQPDPPEVFVLHGMLKTWVADAQGREATLAFHEGPGIVMPAVTRMRDGCSRVHCTALSAARVVCFPPAVLQDCMVQTLAVRQWGQAVMHAELMRRADREWALAALPAVERLQAFRNAFPGLEQRVALHHIASYLGMTAVTLSRARAALRNVYPRNRAVAHVQQA